MSRNLTSTFAFVAIASLAFIQPGAAQTLVGDQMIEEAAMPLVRHHCRGFASIDANAMDRDIVTSDIGNGATTREDLAPSGDEATGAILDTTAGEPSVTARTREDLSPFRNRATSDGAGSVGDHARTRDDLVPLDNEADSLGADEGGQQAMVDMAAISAADCEAAGLLAN